MHKIKIVPFENKFAKEFKQLNMEWLKSFDLFEPVDLKYLDTPIKSIIEPGGRIIMAVDNERIVGTCAIIMKSKKTVELAKLAVLKNIRGKGIGRDLTIEAIKQAKDMGAETIMLVSNKKLAPAIRLYESLGFEHAPIPDDIGYETADIYMEFKILDKRLHAF